MFRQYDNSHQSPAPIIRTCFNGIFAFWKSDITTAKDFAFPSSLARWKRGQELKNHEMSICDATVHRFLRGLWVCPHRRLTQKLMYTGLSNTIKTQSSCLSAGAKTTPSAFETLHQKVPSCSHSSGQDPKSSSEDQCRHAGVQRRGPQDSAISMKLLHTVAPFLGRQSSRICDFLLRSPHQSISHFDESRGCFGRNCATTENQTISSALIQPRESGGKSRTAMQ
jgi:hypothetical protein